MDSTAVLPQGHLLVIGAHAGDVENMAAATVLKHVRAGCSATVVHMTLGEAGHPTLAPAVYAEQRRREISESGRRMGARVIELPYPDGLLPVNDAVKFQVCDIIRAEKPSVILTHWKGSMHKDHTATWEIVQEAIFYAALPAIERDLPTHRVRSIYYPENWEDMDGWRADLYLDVSDVWDEYLAVLRSHELMRGGVSSFRYLDYYDALGTTRGCLGGFRKAVALMAPPGSGVQRNAYLPPLLPVV